MLSPESYSCLYYIRSTPNSVFSLPQEAFQVLVKACWNFTNKLPVLGLDGCKDFVKHVGSCFTPDGAEIVKLKHHKQEHLYLP